MQLLAEIEKRINEENARPKKRYISPATREEVYAMYYDGLRRKIEERGTRNFPENHGQKLYGELTMNVTVDAAAASSRPRSCAPSNSRCSTAGARDRAAPPRRSAASAPAMRRKADQIVDHLALPLHARGRPRDHAERDAMTPAERRPVSTATPSPATRSSTASRRSSTPRSRAQTGQALDYGRLLCPLDGFAATLRRFADGGAPRLQRHGAVQVRGLRAGARGTARARALAEAANTLRFDADGWFGDNTDGVGLVRDIERNAGVALAGARVLLIGAGGAAAGVLGPLLDGAAGARWWSPTARAHKAQALVARHRGVRRAHGVAARLRARWPTAARPSTCVINASASSLQGAAVPVAAARAGARRAGARHDVRRRRPQAFLGWAAAHGARGRDGLGMLVEQAAEAFFVWRGVRPETAPVLAALRAAHGRGA